MPTSTSALRGSFKKCQGQGWICTKCPATRKDQSYFPNFKAALNHERTVHDHEGPMARDKNANRTNETHPLRSSDETCWDPVDHLPLTSEGLRQWEMHAHVDHVYDLVPFWQRGIDAAEKGQVLRLEEFLDKMEGDGGWRTAHEVLGMLGGCQWKTAQAREDPECGGWGEDCDGAWAAGHRGAWGWAVSQSGGWGAASPRVGSDATESDGGWGVREEWARTELMDEAGGPQRAVQGDGRREELRHFIDTIAQQQAANEERRRQMHLFSEMPVEEKIQKIHETIRFLRTHAL